MYSTYPKCLRETHKKPNTYIRIYGYNNAWVGKIQTANFTANLVSRADKQNSKLGKGGRLV